MRNDYGNVTYRKGTNAYVVGKLCVPHPDDNSVPDEIRETFAGLWAEVNAYAKAHPEYVTEEQPYTAPTPTQGELAAKIRAERNKRLAATDCLLMPDYPLPTDRLEAIKVYRQALRDLPQQPGFPWLGGDADDADCPWPTAPILPSAT